MPHLSGKSALLGLLVFACALFCVGLGATGLFAVDLVDPAVRFPEDSCQEAALAGDSTLPDQLNLVSVGARGYGVPTRSRRPDGGWQIRYVENEKCSSGTGENMIKIAGRFGLDLLRSPGLRSAYRGFAFSGDAGPIIAAHSA